ncbi:hypothetical protein [Chryseolinea lacunae]|uniref:DUF1835 domain-containing protein n=1 Tax=Chryseolinea lacunae TaxID=2801331 RepID=A0ABS1KVB4_9BACT|nr:hypothetical protein [Chryseolinea lacunae]MBL0743177.1 hypothetical protein [Chryseolinea lacunae]
MVYHVLNGDALAQRFSATGLAGEVVIARECMVDGNLEGDTVEEFLENRARFVEDEFNEERIHYYSNVVHEFEKLMSAPNGSVFNLWFGYDLFCRTNMWFVLSLLSHLEGEHEIAVVYPSFLERRHIWQEFGAATSEQLLAAYEERVVFSSRDLHLAEGLWMAYKQGDLQRLHELSIYQSMCFPYLQEVCHAHIDRFPHKDKLGRPERVIREIVQKTSRDFKTVFKEFTLREGVYGFGDAQVKKIYDKVIENLKPLNH